MRRATLIAVGLVVLLGLGMKPALAAKKKTARPNIVFIWCDNLGYGDLSLYGSKTVKTPVIDQLAADGVRFNQFYIAHAVCSPSRVALLTGRQPFRTGITDVLRPDGPLGIPDDEITLGEAMKAQGYATCAIGKWHLGDRKQYLPTRHGFDSYFGIPYSMDMKPTILIRDDKIIDDLVGDKVNDITERYTREAIRFITENKDRPFFLYFSHTMPHPPINLPKKYRTPGRPIYQDAIEHVDQQTGLLLAALDKLGLSENTLVIFTSDNGPMHQDGQTGGFRGRITQTYEGGVRVPFVARWPGKIPASKSVDTPAIAYDIFPTLLHRVGGKVPTDRPYDGQDIWTLFTEKDEIERKKPFIWVTHDKVSSMRHGRWKLHVNNRGRQLAKPELYDLRVDPYEKTSLTDQQPEVVARLKKIVTDYEATLPKVWSLKYPVRDPAKLKSGVRRE